MKKILVTSFLFLAGLAVMLLVTIIQKSSMLIAKK
ncbi:MAG: hypothetical protein ACFWT6_06400 [Virgibacillus proomii]|jgi:hypothetical protein